MYYKNSNIETIQSILENIYKLYANVSFFIRQISLDFGIKTSL